MKWLLFFFWFVRSPIVICGEVGCGKTTLMAKMSSLVPEWLSEDLAGPLVVRFTGITHQSSHTHEILTSLCEQLTRIIRDDPSGEKQREDQDDKKQGEDDEKANNEKREDQEEIDTNNQENTDKPQESEEGKSQSTYDDIPHVIDIIT